MVTITFLKTHDFIIHPSCHKSVFPAFKQQRKKRWFAGLNISLLWDQLNVVSFSQLAAGPIHQLTPDSTELTSPNTAVMHVSLRFTWELLNSFHTATVACNYGRNHSLRNKK